MAAVLAGCAPVESTEAVASAAGEADYCELPRVTSEVLAVRPAPGDPPIDDINWFARPVPHDGTDRLLAFASHDQNYLYNITTGAKIRIPDRSDAVATPDGRYMTVPSYYTSDSTVRFYPIAPMLDRLGRGEDADDIEPAFIHDHPAMHRVYYQSTGRVSEESTSDGRATTYRLMFSGTGDESGFRIVDYRFTHDSSGTLVGVDPTPPMKLCPVVTNDFNTPFISKDARYVATYTSERSESTYSPGSSLRILEITETDPASGTTSCEPVLDFGFAAGKADFSFDNSMLTFHISQGAYLTPFVNGGLPEGTITDIVVARLDRDAAGNIVGTSGLQRLTTSMASGVGSYFPAFFPDGTLFWIANSAPRESEAEKRFHFRVADPASSPWERGVFETEAQQAGWRTIASLWEKSCASELPAIADSPFPMQTHEAPWLALSLSADQCSAVVEDARREAETRSIGQGEMADMDFPALAQLCRGLG